MSKPRSITLKLNHIDDLLQVIKQCMIDGIRELHTALLTDIPQNLGYEIDDDQTTPCW